MIRFRDKALMVVGDIPKGETLSYAEVARRAGSPRAFRAVGNILKRNYNPKIPCHRVIRMNGGMGDYNRGGVRRKQELLREEGFTG